MEIGPSPWTENKEMMTKEAIPGVKARMPGASTCTIWVQQDGAKPNSRNVIIAAFEAATGGNIILETHPPYSPDLNVLDLGFLHCTQRLKNDFGVTNVMELVEATSEAFDDYQRETLERCCHCLVLSNGEFLGCKGDNNIRIPYPGINKTQRAEKLPKTPGWMR
ncbi:unnamed protein product, partial [Discosporangium mesarthrocarpum]